MLLNVIYVYIYKLCYNYYRYLENRFKYCVKNGKTSHFAIFVKQYCISKTKIKLFFVFATVGTGIDFVLLLQAGANASRKVEGVMLDRQISKKLKGKVLRTCYTSMPVWSGDSGVDRTTTTEAASV